ncbi:MAG: bifunctional hydroxymethylpyrimidine kinase/phosphomethylpyrimidine kinase [Kiritimatiellia bacterium]
MNRRTAALSIAGSDSGGNAGIQADLRAFSTFGVHGCTVITALTAQNPFGVNGVLSADGAFVRDQIDAVIDCYDIRAVKTGMLCSSEIIESVADALTLHNRILKVVDPVMVATSGARLLEDEAIDTIKMQLLPLADLITPNLPEAGILLERDIETEEDMLAGATELSERFGCSVLLTGGHSRTSAAKDLFVSAEETFRVESPLIEDPVSTHGTGCSLSAAIAASLACGSDLRDAVIEGKAYVYEAIRTGVYVGECVAVLGTPRSIPVEEMRIIKDGNL